MARFAKPVERWALRQSTTSLIAWAARDDSHPGAKTAADHWILHASPGWNLEDSAEVAGRTLITAFRAETGATATNLVLTHRWRDTLAEIALSETCLWDNADGLGLCGDWRLSGRIEAAQDSGTALACVMLAAR